MSLRGDASFIGDLGNIDAVQTRRNSLSGLAELPTRQRLYAQICSKAACVLEPFRCYC